MMSAKTGRTAARAGGGDLPGPRQAVELGRERRMDFQTPEGGRLDV